jgi:hypothetical protein
LASSSEGGISRKQRKRETATAVEKKARKKEWLQNGRMIVNELKKILWTQIILTFDFV